MKTYKDLSTIETMDKPMEPKYFWSIIEHCQTQPTADLRDYELLQFLAQLPIPEIVGFALQVEERAAELLNNEMWRNSYDKELEKNTNFTIDDIALWAIFQGQEFYQTSLETPMFLIKRIDDFKGASIPENKIVTHALGLKIAEEYIRFENFIPDNLKEKLIW